MTTADPTRLPSIKRNGRQGNAPTSYAEGTTPEQALAVAVIMQAIHDLQSTDEMERFEAHEFFLQPKGPWADMRRFYFQAVKLDDDWLHAHLSERLEPPERPHRTWSYMALLDVMPKDAPFTAVDVSEMTGLNLPQVTSKFQSLVRHGHIVRVDVGIYCVAAYEATWRRKQAEAVAAKKPKHTPFAGFDAPEQNAQNGPTQKAILMALHDGRETIREIGWDVHLNYNALKCALDRLIDRGIVEKDGAKYRPVPQTAVAAATG